MAGRAGCREAGLPSPPHVSEGHRSLFQLLLGLSLPRRTGERGDQCYSTKQTLLLPHPNMHTPMCVYFHGGPWSLATRCSDTAAVHVTPTWLPQSIRGLVLDQDYRLWG